MRRRVLVVDDERLARERLADLLAEFDDVVLVGESDSGRAAITATLELRPDIMLLDVKMPGLDGFGVVEALEKALAADAQPIVIFVTAFDQYAIQAFDASALDYLQKPVSRARLAKALERAVRQLAQRDGAKAAGQPTPPPTPATRFAVSRGDVTQLVRPDEIDWIDAAGNYVRLHVRGAAYMLRSPISDFEVKLDPQHFLRIHRSTIVNLDRVAKIEPFTHGEYVVVTADGTRLRSSRAHSARLRDLLRSGVG
jgi:two-component system LytT family response regulator